MRKTRRHQHVIIFLTNIYVTFETIFRTATVIRVYFALYRFVYAFGQHDQQSALSTTINAAFQAALNIPLHYQSNAPSLCATTLNQMNVKVAKVRFHLRLPYTLAWALCFI